MTTTRKPTAPKPLDPEADVTIEFEGETYTWPVDKMDDLDLMQLFAAGQVFDAVRWLLGEDDWNRVRASISTDGRVSFRKMIEFTNLVAEGPLGNFADSLRS